MNVAVKSIVDPKYRINAVKVRLFFQKLSDGQWECELHYDGQRFYVKESSLKEATEKMTRLLEDR